MTNAERQTARKLQATLTKIANKEPVFFNVALFKSKGLVKEHGKTIDNKTNWVLTNKANQILNIQL